MRMSSEARELHGVLFEVGGFVSEHVACIYLVVCVGFLPLFWMAVAMTNCADVAMSCAMQLVCEEPHAFASRHPYLAVGAGVCCMYSGFAVAEYPYRRSRGAMKNGP